MKIVVSDYDKTFCIEKDPLEENKKAVDIWRHQGNIFVFATGRSYQDFKKEALRHQLYYDYVILNHGALILDSHDQILYHMEIDDSVMEKLPESLRLKVCTNLFCCSGKESRVPITTPQLSKIHLEYHNDQLAKEVEIAINKTYKNDVIAYHISECKIEIVASSVNKANAISRLAEKFHWNRLSIYTIGDGNTDLLMIRSFHGFRMEQSVPALIPYAEGSYDTVSHMIYDLMK